MARNVLKVFSFLLFQTILLIAVIHYQTITSTPCHIQSRSNEAEILKILCYTHNKESFPVVHTIFPAIVNSKKINLSLWTCSIPLDFTLSTKLPHTIDYQNTNSHNWCNSQMIMDIRCYFKNYKIWQSSDMHQNLKSHTLFFQLPCP